MSTDASAREHVLVLARRMRDERNRYEAALAAIRAGCRYFNARGVTHHDACEHPGCIANRALTGKVPRE